VTRRLPAPLPWLAGLLALYLIAPLVAGVQQARLADWSSIDVGALRDACAVSIASATVATLVIALGGIPLGYVLARVRGRAMAALGFLVQLPLALPPLTSGNPALVSGRIRLSARSPRRWRLDRLVRRHRSG
jgi:molybdate transport system permease protein